MGSDSLKDKKKFQDLLIELDDTDDEATPTGNHGSLPVMIKELETISPDVPEVSAQERISSMKRPLHALSRVSSAKSLTRPYAAPEKMTASTTSAKGQDSPESSRPDTAPKASSMRIRSVQDLHRPTKVPGEMPFALPFQGAIPRGLNKRKRASIKVVAEARRVFKDLVFFFVPNSDISADRRFRIAKAIEYGAAWANEWHQAVTHIIVDNDVNYEVVLQTLKMTEVPKNVVVVKATYASECLVFRALLNPKQHIYNVPGHEDQMNASLSTKEITETDSRSLQLKNAISKEMPVAEAAKPHSTSQASESFGSNNSSIQQIAASGPKCFSVSKRALDELDNIIMSVKAINDLPLDPDEDQTPQITEEGTSSENESADERPPIRRKLKLDNPAAGFQCLQKPGDDVLNNPNQKVIDILQQMATYYDSTNDTWRTISYRKAIATLRRTNRRITTSAEAIQLPFIGQRLADKIEEIAVTHRLRRLEATRHDPTDVALRTFLQIYGVGTQQAMLWIQQGHRSLQDLLTSVPNLTANQRIGIAHLEDFASRIPRAEVTRLGAIVTKALQDIDAAFQVTIGGSYRRGAADSGDIDLIITRPDTEIGHIRTVVLETLVPRLFLRGFLTATLASTNRRTGTKWHGACQLPLSRYAPIITAIDTAEERAKALRNPNPWRRIDLLLVPSSEIGAAMIYFTGNDILNRSMRLLARKKGMCLNQRGLFKNVLRGAGQVKLAEGNLVESKDERKIFEALGVPWRTPEERQI
ncbi:hypothetical protein FH972_021987 [Carpinus fangiana]|uniref:DNA polymerase lambda n=1 Tax=Carpinus fangiana TaxID=176857 RepID=A0A5N6KT40_9ROSI|nr:hypothetical protein FH972_021987 [Carpinus fangiana]